MINRIRAFRHVIFAALGSILAWRYLPADYISIVSSEVIAFFGFLMAAVLPAMLLTATAIRGFGISRVRVEALSQALEEQMYFYSGLFLIAFVAAVLILIAKPWAFCTPPGSCTRILLYSVLGVEITTQHVNGIVAGLVALLISQFMNVLGGIMGLLSLNAEAALAEAQRIEQADISDVEISLSRIRNEEGYGDTIELPDFPTKSPNS